MDIINPTQQVPYVEVDPTLRIKPIVKNIGVWDMDTDQEKIVDHGLGSDFNTIIAIQAFIFNDASTKLTNLNYFRDAADPTLMSGGVGENTSLGVSLYRRTGGNFDNNSYDDGVMNRGYVIFWYMV